MKTAVHALLGLVLVLAASPALADTSYAEWQARALEEAARHELEDDHDQAGQKIFLDLAAGNNARKRVIFGSLNTTAKTADVHSRRAVAGCDQRPCKQRWDGVRESRPSGRRDASPYRPRIPPARA